MANQNTTIRKAYRQGELVFIPLDKKDSPLLNLKNDDRTESVWQKLQTNVIREGEATGHKHEVIAQTPSAVSLLAPTQEFINIFPDMALVGLQDRMLVAQESVEIVHPEHQPLKLGQGMYLIIIQREYDELKAERRVMD